MYAWDAPKESERADVLANLDVERFLERVAAEDRIAGERLAASTSNQTRAVALTMLADARQMTADTSGAQRLATEASHVAADVGDIALSARTFHFISIFALRSGDLAAAREASAAATAAAEQADNPNLCSITKIQAANVAIVSRQSQSALDVLNESFAIGRRHRLTRAKGYALAGASCAYVLANDHRALSLLGRAQLLHERVGDRSALARTYNNFGTYCYRDNGRYVDAIPYFDRALDLLVMTDDIVSIINALDNAVRANEQYANVRAGEYRSAIEAFGAQLSDKQRNRFADSSMLALDQSGRDFDHVTFESDLVVEAPFLFLPIPHLD